MKKCVAALLICALMLTLCAAAAGEVQRSPFLDAAFSLLEKDNIFQRRYNEITGAGVESLFELGVPYFFGQQTNWDGSRLTNVDKLMACYPEYNVLRCLEKTKFFHKNQWYVYGMDCSGYTRWIYHQCGLPMHPKLEAIMTKHAYRKDHLFNGGTNWVSESKPMPAFEELKDTLQVGDLLLTKHSARHIMMYIGTLADYGFTAEEVPELAPYLEYPLVIHCGPSPFYGEWFEKLIRENPERYGNCNTTNGGVEVSIVGVPADQAPYHTHVQVHDFDYFLIDGGNYMLTLRDIFEATSFCWYRMDPNEGK